MSGNLSIWFGGEATSTAVWYNNNNGSSWDNAWQVAGIGDFDGGGRSDILWRHTSGKLAIWYIDGASFVREANLGVLPSAWQVKGVLRE